jgi:hypothetical protein
LRIPFADFSWREDEPKSALPARQGDDDKGAGNLEMKLPRRRHDLLQQGDRNCG